MIIVAMAITFFNITNYFVTMIEKIVGSIIFSAGFSTYNTHNTYNGLSNVESISMNGIGHIQKILMFYNISNIQFGQLQKELNSELLNYVKDDPQKINIKYNYKINYQKCDKQYKSVYNNFDKISDDDTEDVRMLKFSTKQCLKKIIGLDMNANIFDDVHQIINDVVKKIVPDSYSYKMFRKPKIMPTVTSQNHIMVDSKNMPHLSILTSNDLLPNGYFMKSKKKKLLQSITYMQK